MNNLLPRTSLPSSTQLMHMVNDLTARGVGIQRALKGVQPLTQAQLEVVLADLANVHFPERLGRPDVTKAAQQARMQAGV